LLVAGCWLLELVLVAGAGCWCWCHELPAQGL